MKSSLINALPQSILRKAFRGWVMNPEIEIEERLKKINDFNTLGTLYPKTIGNKYFAAPFPVYPYDEMRG